MRHNLMFAAIEVSLKPAVHRCAGKSLGRESGSLAEPAHSVASLTLPLPPHPVCWVVP